jgi:hypothetical protein
MWSGQGTAVKFLEAHMGPIAITFVPFYITTVLFVPLLIYKRRKNPAAEKPTPAIGESSCSRVSAVRCWRSLA